MEASRYYTAVFLDVSQAFDKVWHRELLYKIKNRFSIDVYAIIRSYLLHRTLESKMVTQLKEINSGMLQGSILGPALSAIQR